MKLVFLWLVLVNLLTYGIYWLDKRRAAKGGRRTSERELLLWALAGGSPAAIVSMRKHGHTTRKMSFKIGIALVVLLQIVTIWFWLT